MMVLIPMSDWLFLMLRRRTDPDAVIVVAVIKGIVVSTALLCLDQALNVHYWV